MTNALPDIESRQRYQNIGFALGPAIALLLFFLPPPEGLAIEGWRTAAVGAWLAIWWATEAIPLPVTSLLPLVLFPLLSITDFRGAATPYANPVNFLLLGGFIIAKSLERWSLHRRIALNVLARVGNHPQAIIGGFMGVTALLSMWISNTASTLMMLPIAISVAAVVAPENDKNPLVRNFTVVLVLGIAYAASIGGLGTPIGTAPNALVVGYMKQTFDLEISFPQWMMFGVPAVLLFVPIAWFVLTKLTYRFALSEGGDAMATVRAALAEMGKITKPEQRTAMLFAVVALLWMLRLPLNGIPGLAGITDAGIAIFGAMALFVIPSGNKDGTFLLSWEWANKIPWGMLLLFGGGLSFAAAVSSSGLSIWLGESLQALTSLHLIVLMGAIVALIVFLTELTSNTGTTAAMLPVLGAIAGIAEANPMFLIGPATLAASCAFMLPVATAPNAIVYGDGHVTVPQMAKAGFRLNLVAIPLLTALAYLLVPLIFG